MTEATRGGDSIMNGPIQRNYPGSSGHYQEKCEFGMIHAQCRCPDPNKATMRVVCNMPQTHRAVAMEDGHLVALQGVDIDRLRDWMARPMTGSLSLDTGRITFEAVEGGLIVRTRAYGDDR